MSLNIAHRGASGYEKENTMPAFELAVNVYTVNSEAAIMHRLECGVDMIISNYPDRVKACIDKY